jgi:hypothetical protein
MADEFIVGKRAEAERFALSQKWSAVGRNAWLKPDGTCVHLIGAIDQLAGVKRGERVYVLGEADAATASALKKVQALVATVNPDETISHSGFATRNFPPPWRIERMPGCFVVKDANGQPLAHVYSGDRHIGNSLTEDEASRIASNIAKLPDLLSAKDR